MLDTASLRFVGHPETWGWGVLVAWQMHVLGRLGLEKTGDFDKDG